MIDSLFSFFVPVRQRLRVHPHKCSLSGSCEEYMVLDLAILSPFLIVKEELLVKYYEK